MHLTPDQVFRITEFWKMTSDERDYFITLLEIERAADNNYKKLLKQKANSIKEKNTKIKVITGREDASISQQDLFYHSHWAILIIHILATSSNYRNVIQLQKKLELPNSIFEKYLNYLQDQKLIARNGNELIVESGPKHSQSHHQLLFIFLICGDKRPLCICLRKTSNPFIIPTFKQFLWLITRNSFFYFATQLEKSLRSAVALGMKKFMFLIVIYLNYN